MQDHTRAEQVDRFAKLFVFPGVAHCRSATGPDESDVLSPLLMAWMETQTAAEIIASRRDETGTVTRMRPVYPYPTVARYAGRRVL